MTLLLQPLLLKTMWPIYFIPMMTLLLQTFCAQLMAFSTLTPSLLQLPVSPQATAKVAQFLHATATIQLTGFLQPTVIPQFTVLPLTAFLWLRAGPSRHHS